MDKGLKTLQLVSSGAHIRVVRGRTQELTRGLYDHHMLLTQVISASVVMVIHYTSAVEGANRGQEDSLSSFSWFGGNDGETGVITEEKIDMKPENLELLEYQDGMTRFTGEEAIERARQRLQEKEYGLMSNNCECFVNWALRGEAVSYQAVDGAVASSFGAIAGAMQGYKEEGTVAGTLLGAMKGLVSGFVDHREKRQ